VVSGSRKKDQTKKENNQPGSNKGSRWSGIAPDEAALASATMKGGVQSRRKRKKVLDEVASLWASGNKKTINQSGIGVQSHGKKGGKPINWKQ